VEDNPVVVLNHAVAVSMLAGPHAGLTLLEDLETDNRMATSHRFHAVRAHLLAQTGDRGASRAAYETAVRYATNTRQQRYLRRRIAGSRDLRL
jgi:predicted RNA polymerase sigma factor